MLPLLKLSATEITGSVETEMALEWRGFVDPSFVVVVNVVNSVVFELVDFTRHLKNSLKILFS